jgi:hypothetical protein
VKTLRVCPDNHCHVKQESLACESASQSRKPLGSRMMMSARLVAVRELQSATGEELDVLPSSPSAASGIPSVLEKAFKGEL